MRYLACRAGFDLGLMSLLPLLRMPAIVAWHHPLYRTVLRPLVPPGTTLRERDSVLGPLVWSGPRSCGSLTGSTPDGRRTKRRPGADQGCQTGRRMVFSVRSVAGLKPVWEVISGTTPDHWEHTWSGVVVWAGLGALCKDWSGILV